MSLQQDTFHTSYTFAKQNNRPYVCCMGGCVCYDSSLFCENTVLYYVNIDNINCICPLFFHYICCIING